MKFLSTYQTSLFSALQRVSLTPSSKSLHLITNLSHAPLRKFSHHFQDDSSEHYHHPLITQSVPEFSCTTVTPDMQFTQFSSKNFKGKYWILFFYPLDFTFVCPTEIIAFSDRAKEFEDLGCSIVGCSVDSKNAHLAWMNIARSAGGIGKLNFPLISDIDKKISKKFNVLLESGIALRALFIMDPNGKIRHSTINDLPIGRSVDETLRLVKAIQFADKHGEVCPANWQPGSDTITPNPKDSKKYFEKKFK